MFWHIRQPNVNSNELQSPYSKNHMVRYPSMIVALFILEAHTDMDRPQPSMSRKRICMSNEIKKKMDTTMSSGVSDKCSSVTQACQCPTDTTTHLKCLCS